MGLFWYDRFKPIFEVSINLIVSIVLVQKYEIVGILLGTIVSSLSTCFWIEPYVLMKHGIKTEWKKKLAFYFLQYGQRAVSTAAGTAASWFVCSRLPHTNLWMAGDTGNYLLIDLQWHHPSALRKIKGILLSESKNS